MEIEELVSQTCMGIGIRNENGNTNNKFSDDNSIYQG
jgi:hypothetical protein